MYSAPRNTSTAYSNQSAYTPIDPEAQYVAQPVDAPLPGQGFDGQKVDDYVAQYVRDCGKKIRMGFIRKVYIILSMQLAITVAIVACTMLIGCTTYDEGTMYHCPAVFYMNTHVWFFWTFLALTIVTMCVLFCVRRRHPVNLIMLFLFVVATYANSDEGRRAIVIAAAATLALFVALTIFACQARIDFRVIPVIIFSILWVGLIWVLFAFLTPWGFSVVYLWGLLGAIIFSLYIVWDTHLVMKRLGPDEWVFGAVNLYIDVINLFICLLALIGGGSRR